MRYRDAVEVADDRRVIEMNDRQLREVVLQMMADFGALFLNTLQSTKLSKFGRKGTFQVALSARTYERFDSGRVLIENGHEFSLPELSRSAIESQASLSYLSKQARGFFVLEILTSQPNMS